ncbi:MAG: ABC transporter permease [Bacteroidales bacterium]|nr:ABC transporter permease [Bacteroidales bacterium]
MKSNTWTIIKKEFARFFGDRQLLFTTVIMPGLLIYIIYSLMGVGIKSMVSQGADEVVTMRVENLPPSMAPLLATDSCLVVVEQGFGQEDVDNLEDKSVNVVLARFPEGFDSLVAAYTPQAGVAAPNVEIYYNSANNASLRVFSLLSGGLTAYEEQMSNRFDINRADREEQKFDQATTDQVLGNVWSKLLPMIIVMMLFSGVMSIAPSSIAGEKERGTIATLLVTPMRRNELAIGKIVSLSSIGLLSGISSFVGIALSLPKMVHGDASDLDLAFNYSLRDYTALLLVIFATVLVMSAAVSLLSAMAKDVKNAGTMVTPLMMVVTLAGLLPMFQSGASHSLAVYLVPFYNSIEVMVGLFAHELAVVPLLVTLAANLIYSVAAVWGLTRMFNSEKVMFSR